MWTDMTVIGAGIVKVAQSKIFVSIAVTIFLYSHPYFPLSLSVDFRPVTSVLQVPRSGISTCDNLVSIDLHLKLILIVSVTDSTSQDTTKTW